MNSKPPESDFEDYFRGLRLKDDTAAEILQSHPLRSSARFSVQTKTAFIVAAIVVAVTLAVVFVPSGQDERNPAIVQPEQQNANTELPIAADNSEVEDGPTNTPAENPQTPASVSYRLVAVRSHPDGCPHCRMTGLVYREIASRMHDIPVECLEIDLSRPASDPQGAMAVREYHLESLVDGRSETAFVSLVDHSGRLIREFKPSVGADRIIDQVLKLTKKPDDQDPAEGG